MGEGEGVRGGQQAPESARGKASPWEGGRGGGGGGLASGEVGRPERQGETINVSCSMDEIEIMI